MKYYLYFLKSERDGNYYIGSTSDLLKRLTYHNRGANKSTRFRRPFKLVYFEEYNDKHTALQREFFLKSPKGFLAKKKIIKNINSGVAQPKGSPLGAVAQI